MSKKEIKKKLKSLGFKVLTKGQIKREIRRLDKEVQNLISDEDAYLNNRRLVWDLTDLL